MEYRYSPIFKYLAFFIIAYIILCFDMETIQLNIRLLDKTVYLALFLTIVVYVLDLLFIKNQEPLIKPNQEQFTNEEDEIGKNCRDQNDDPGKIVSPATKFLDDTYSKYYDNRVNS